MPTGTLTTWIDHNTAETQAQTNALNTAKELLESVGFVVVKSDIGPRPAHPSGK